MASKIVGAWRDLRLRQHGYTSSRVVRAYRQRFEPRRCWIVTSSPVRLSRQLPEALCSSVWNLRSDSLIRPPKSELSCCVKNEIDSTDSVHGWQQCRITHNLPMSHAMLRGNLSCQVKRLREAVKAPGASRKSQDPSRTTHRHDRELHPRRHRPTSPTAYQIAKTSVVALPVVLSLKCLTAKPAVVSLQSRANTIRLLARARQLPTYL